MAHTVSSERVEKTGLGNVDSSGNAETRGAVVYGEVDITSYANGGEVVPAAAMGLNVVYNAQYQMEEVDTYDVRAVTVASDGKSVTVNIDTAGTGTEVSAGTDVGRVSFIAWGEQLGSGSN
jgi:hypothetical protein